MMNFFRFFRYEFCNKIFFKPKHFNLAQSRSNPVCGARQAPVKTFFLLFSLFFCVSCSAAVCLSSVTQPQLRPCLSFRTLHETTNRRCICTRVVGFYCCRSVPLASSPQPRREYKRAQPARKSTAHWVVFWSRCCQRSLLWCCAYVRCE